MTNNKYYGRSISNISRDDSAIESGGRDPSWFNDYVENLEKISTKSKNQEYSAIDQINRILGNKSKYSTVDEAISDMQKRTGLSEYLKLQTAASDENSDDDLSLLEKIPVMKTYIDNYIEHHPGATADSVVHDLLKLKPVVDQLPPGQGKEVPAAIYRYINKKIFERDSAHPRDIGSDLELGKVDLSVDDGITKDNDPFGGCIPNRDSK